jgi:hypothetical protein
MLRNQHDRSADHAAALHGFAEWGLGQVAYVKQEEINGMPVHVVHGADGESLAAADSYALAAAIVVQNGMTPLPVH